jgi:CHAT domain-containing protein
MKLIANITLLGLSLIFSAQPLITQAQSAPAINAQQLGNQYRTVADILSLIEQIKPDPERIKAYRAQLTKPLPPADAFWFTKRDALLERMDAADALGDIQARVQTAEAIMAIFRERKDRIREMEYAFSYAGILREAGRGAEAFAIEEEMARDPQSYAHWVLSYHNRRSNSYADAGNVQAAQPHLDAANIEYQSKNGYKSLPNMTSANAYVNAHFKRAQGKYVEAEALYLNALKDSQRLLNMTAGQSNWAKHALPGTSIYSTYLGYRLGYARMLLDMGRVQDAERVVREPLLWALERTGKYSPLAVRGAAAYTSILMAQGRYVEAEKLALMSIEMAEGIGAPPESLFMRDARRALARALMAQGKAAEADAQFEKSPIGAADFVESPRAVAAIQNGRTQAVLEALRVQAERSVANVGEGNPLAGEASGLYAMALASQSDTAAQQQAIAFFRAAMPAILKARQQSGVADDAMRAQIRQWMLSSYLQLLAQQARSGDQAAVAESFALADWLRGSGTQAAVVASAARAAAGDAALAQVVRREQDMRTELIGLHRSMLRLSSLSPEQLKASNEDPAALRARIDALTREHGGLFADLSKRFPKYANLIDPQPPTLAEAQRSLRQGEVLVSILTTPQRSYIWALPATGAASFHVSELGENEIAPIVRKLRAALDVGDLEPQKWAVFDVAASHRLYRELLAPVSAAFKDARSLVLTSSGALGGLPPAVLVTREHTLGTDRSLPFERYAAVPWLAKDIATAQVPSINAWVSLRNQTASPAAKAFTGFGDPVFSSQASAATAAAATRGLRAAASSRPSEQTLRANQAVAWTPYSKLAALPDTRDELLAMAQALGADTQRDVVLGKDVTKQRVMQTDLSTSRVIAFATHGLLAGDFQGVDQPSLALSVAPGKDADKEPATALLTLDDVLQLKLNADWVVLSACNTAAADGQGAEAISGLGRGFFYAGSRALLVTHWAVDSESAKDLVTHLFNAYAKDPQLSRARALQGAMTHILNSASRDKAYSLAHPLFWAPYALIGEAGR